MPKVDNIPPIGRIGNYNDWRMNRIEPKFNTEPQTLHRLKGPEAPSSAPLSSDQISEMQATELQQTKNNVRRTFDGADLMSVNDLDEKGSDMTEQKYQNLNLQL